MSLLLLVGCIDFSAGLWAGAGDFETVELERLADGRWLVVATSNTGSASPDVFSEVDGGLESALGDRLVAYPTEPPSLEVTAAGGVPLSLHRIAVSTLEDRVSPEGDWWVDADSSGFAIRDVQVSKQGAAVAVLDTWGTISMTGDWDPTTHTLSLASWDSAMRFHVDGDTMTGEYTAEHEGTLTATRAVTALPAP